MTAVPMAPLAEVYSAEAAVSALESGKIVIFGAGLGIPFLSTDTTGAVRAAEIGADAMLMAKNVDYIYTDDPRKNPNAKKLTSVKASEVLAMNLKAIDSTATAFCMSGGMPIHVFGLREPDDIIRAVHGETLGTVVTPE
jgi:uridylate kinase